MPDRTDFLNRKEMDNMYWVVPGRFLAGPYPNLADEISRMEKIAYFRSNKINHFIDLTELGESENPYLNVIENHPSWFSEKIKFSRLSIPDLGVPSKRQMEQILNLIDASLARKENIYLHCMGGLGRTGTVVGCYLVRQGLTGEQALHRIETLRKSTVNHLLSSPETAEQFEFIQHWEGLSSFGVQG